MVNLKSKINGDSVSNILVDCLRVASFRNYFNFEGNLGNCFREERREERRRSWKVELKTSDIEAAEEESA